MALDSMEGRLPYPMGLLRGVARFVPGLFLLAAAGASPQACPDPADSCGCLGHAADFAIVAEKFAAGSGRSGGYRQGVEIDNAVCASTGVFRETRVASSVLLLASAGKAGVCKQTRSCYRSSGEVYCETSNGLFVGGDLATGGGSLTGEADVVGERLLDGSHERLPDCGTAKGDLQSASAALASLPSTEDLGDVVVVAPKLGAASRAPGAPRGYGYGGGAEATRVLAAGPGVHVFRASSVKLKSLKRRYCYTSSGSRYCETEVSAAVLEIALDPNTTAVILNVDGKLLLSSYSQLRVTGGSAPVLVHLIGPKGRAKLGAGAFVGPAILAGGPIAAGAGAQLSNLLGPKVTLKGANITDTLLCGPPPPPPPPALCCDTKFAGCLLATETECVGPYGGTVGPEGSSCLGSGVCGEPPPPVCCVSPPGYAATCASIVPVPEPEIGFSCASLGMLDGAAGSVCDASTGSCVPSGTESTGSCCDLSDWYYPGTRACLSGTDASLFCEEGFPGYEANATCDAGGSPVCRVP